MSLQTVKVICRIAVITDLRSDLGDFKLDLKMHKNLCKNKIPPLTLSSIIYYNYYNYLDKVENNVEDYKAHQ